MSPAANQQYITFPRRQETSQHKPYVSRTAEHSTALNNTHLILCEEGFILQRLQVDLKQTGQILQTNAYSGQ